METPEGDAAAIPPEPRRAARRALVLASVACRAFLEARATEPWALQMHQDVLEWVSNAGILEEFEDWEKAVLRAPMGELTAPERVNASWLSEGLGVLAWALGGPDFPPHDQMINPKPVADRLGFLSDKPGPLLAPPKPRSAEEIHEMGERMFAVHWRVRDFSLNRKAIDFKNVGRNAWMGERGIRQLPLLEGDLAIRGVPISKASEEDWRSCFSIAMERHRAANWLMGAHPVYSEVDTST